MKPALALVALAAATGTFVAQPAVAQDAPPPASASASTSDGLNHAAVVVDTGDGVVRKMCLAFSEAELSGIEALRRVDTRPNRFETFSGKGSGVCMLCGVGCPSGQCFCDPDKFWAYHRAGPGESRYQVSSLGASSTVVRDGDVEAWRWGTGAAPVKTSVSEVCDVPEPPARTTGGSTTTSPPPDETTTTSVPTPTSTASPAVSGPAPTAPGATVRPGAIGATVTPTTAPTDTTSPAPPDPGDDPTPDGASGSDADHAPEQPGERAAAVDDPGSGESRRTGQIASLGAFAVLMGGLLGWRARLRRAKRRGSGPVR
jgi:hypothetical protein